MPWSSPKVMNHETSAFLKTSQYSDASDVWEQIHQSIIDGCHYEFHEKNDFHTFSDDRVFKVTVIVEEQ